MGGLYGEMDVTKMNPAVKAKWIAALRSGEYEQTTGRLRNGDSFCCLGVLCNVHAAKHPLIAARQDDPGVYMGCTVMPPDTVRDWAGIRDHLYLMRLAERNDSGATFAQISDVIERDL